MTIFIFTGPTLPPKLARRHWKGPEYLRPVAQGDIYRISRRRPWGIGIVDGYFERQPAVWHKEILWALTQGVRVYGSASIGALRAAELAPFGMIGVGSIYEDYANGVQEDDDEVTLVHAPSKRDYCPTSEAMANIRRTLQKAVWEGVVREMTAEQLVKIGKSLFYPDRTYDRILEEGHVMQLPEVELSKLREWLPDGKVDQKRLDALAMLDRMRGDVERHRRRCRPSFSLSNTIYWHRARRAALKSSGR